MKVIIFLSLIASFAFAEKGPDLKKLQFTAKRTESLHGLAIQFTPPTGHHFNMDAPTEISQVTGLKAEKAQLDKKPADIRASWQEEMPKCEVSAQLYLCDDKNTYCVPVKKKFTCSELTVGKEVQGVAETATKANEAKKSEVATDLFILNDAKVAIEKAKAEKKLLMIDFFGVWCPPCNVLNETVFSTKEFKKFEKDFVFLKLDADSEISWNLKAKYNVKGYPTVVIANPETEEILRIVGSRKPNAFYAQMRKAMKFKNVSFAERVAKADSMKDPEAAFELAQMYLEQEDFTKAMQYYLIGQKKGNLTDDRKNQMLSATIGLLEGSKNQAAVLESAIAVYPFGVETYDRADKLVKVAEDLKDDSMKNRALNAQFKNAEYLLKNPSLYKNAELTEADLYTILADVYETLKDDAKMKENYMKAYEAYTKQIKASGLDEKTERGNNIERIYCLFKAGRVDEANKMWEEMQALYPNEFTFYYSQASAMKEADKPTLALEKAEKALQYSYGDNKLRAVNLLADLKAKQGKKREAISLIDETLKNFKAPEDPNVRTHRYLGKLKDLKEKIQKN